MAQHPDRPDADRRFHCPSSMFDPGFGDQEAAPLGNAFSLVSVDIARTIANPSPPSRNQSLPDPRITDAGFAF
jgi:hypothetical protein